MQHHQFQFLHLESVFVVKYIKSLTSMFSPQLLKLIHCLINRASNIFCICRELVVLAEKVVIPMTDVTTKSPSIILFNILNLLPTASPWSTGVVNDVIPVVVADPTAATPYHESVVHLVKYQQQILQQ